MTKPVCPADILLIEDNPGDAKLFQKCFKRDGRESNIHFVYDGEEALHFLNKTGPYAKAVRPHIIVMDLNLPKIDGKELLKAIKSDVSLKTIPVIILTSSDNGEDVRQSYDLGANCVLIKGGDFDSVTRLFNMVEAFWLNTVCLPPSRSPRKSDSKFGTEIAPTFQ